MSSNAQPKKQKRGEKERARNEPLEKTNTEDNTNDNLLSWKTTVKAAAGAASYVLFKRCVKWPVLRVVVGGGSCRGGCEACLERGIQAYCVCCTTINTHCCSIVL